MSDRDAILEAIVASHHELVEAGRAYTAGDRDAALRFLEDVRIGLVDAIADLRRALDPEPAL